MHKLENVYYHTRKFEIVKYSNNYLKNQTGWNSGTRWLNDHDGNPNNDSILNDKPRGTGIYLGGTIAQTFGWKETITIS